VPENTKQSPKKITDLELTRASNEDELQSAKILFREGLNDEAKKKLYQILIAYPHYQKAQTLLQQIQDAELKIILNQSASGTLKKTVKSENADSVIEKLNSDLGLNLNLSSFDPSVENWTIQTKLSVREQYDLGVAFFEMGCYRDAIRELKNAEKNIRIEETFLGELGVAVVALYAECLILLEQVYEAKAYLMPIINEPDIRHEEKTILFYLMGRIEEALSQIASAKGWFQKTLDVDPSFRDTQFRLKQIQ
jgi:tetratricopeptide (TPR) repeat protein